MPSHNNHDTAALFRQRAAECVKLAAVSIDADVEVQYKAMAEQYVKLAECEECASERDRDSLNVQPVAG